MPAAIGVAAGALGLVNSASAHPPGGYGYRGYYVAPGSYVPVGYARGAVYGKSDAKGNTVTAEEVDAGSLFATIYSNLGINPHKNYYVGSRPIPLVDPGTEPIAALVK